MEVFLTVFFGFLALAALMIGVNLNVQKQVQKANQATLTDQSSRAALTSTAREDFLVIQGDDWPRHIFCRSGGNAVLPLSRDKQTIRLVNVGSRSEFELANDFLLRLDQIVAVSTRPTTRKEITTRTEEIPISMSNNRSPVGRAVVGGLLLGPVGAVAGAASGLGGKTTISHKEKRISETIQVPAPNMLLIGTTDTERPVLKIHFDDFDAADEWQYLLLGILAARK